MSSRYITSFRILCALLLVWNLIAPRFLLAAVRAEEDVSLSSDPTPEPTPSETPTPAPSADSTPVPSADPEPTADPSPSPSPTAIVTEVVLTTGDATSSASTDTALNETILTGTPSGQLSCQIGVQLECPEDRTNTAALTTDTDARSETGDNTSTAPASTTTVTTGSALAVAQSETSSNLTSIVTPAPSTPIPASFLPSTTPEASPSPSPIQACLAPTEAASTIDNEARLESTTTAESHTGANVLHNNAGAGVMTTGDAYAIAVATNLINTTLIDSTISSLIVTILATEVDHIDLNALWRQFLSADTMSPATLPQATETPLTLQNASESISDVHADALTGENISTSAATTQMRTGDAYAVAQSTTVANAVLLRSQILFGLFTILGDSAANIIVPRSELFSQLQPTTSPVEAAPAGSVANFSELTQAATATAQSGENHQIGSGTQSLTTGTATAHSVASVRSNLSLSDTDHFGLQILGLGSWEFHSGLGDVTDTGAQETTLTLDNSAVIHQNVSATANTGSNIQHSETGALQMQTGDAYALARAETITNARLTDSHWFSGVISVLGNWSGKVIVAYPELSVALRTDQAVYHPGDKVSYEVTFANTGYDEATATVGSLQIPTGFSYLSDTCPAAHTLDGRQLSWQFGVFPSGQITTCRVELLIDPQFSFTSRALPQWSIVTPALAADTASTPVAVYGRIATVDPQTNTLDDATSIETLIIHETDTTENVPEPKRDASLFVSATNNVNGFVYPGDTIIFSLQVHNTSGVQTDSLRFITTLSDASGRYIGTHTIVGRALAANQRQTASFSLRLPNTLTGGLQTFVTKTIVTGETTSGGIATSNTATTRFSAKSRTGILSRGEVPLPAEVQALDSGEVLGAMTEASAPAPEPARWPFYLVIVLLTGITILSTIRQPRRSPKEIAHAISILICAGGLGTYALTRLLPFFSSI